MCQSVSTGPLERRLGLIVPVCLNSKFEPPLPNPNVPDFGSIWYTTGYRSGVETSHSFQAQLEIKSIFTMAMRLAKTWTLWSSMTPILGSAKERNSFGNRRFPLRQKKNITISVSQTNGNPTIQCSASFGVYAWAYTPHNGNAHGFFYLFSGGRFISAIAPPQEHDMRVCEEIGRTPSWPRRETSGWHVRAGESRLP